MPICTGDKNQSPINLTPGIKTETKIQIFLFQSEKYKKYSDKSFCDLVHYYFIVTFIL